MMDQQWVYLNGRFVRAAQARVSAFDRGFLFAHAAYEVTAVFAARLIDFEGHMTRLERTLGEIGIPNPHSPADWEALHRKLIEHNQMTEGLVYLQVTGGAYGARDFAGPKVIEPSIFMFAAPRSLIGGDARDGISVITLPDTRWARRDLKTTQLVSQVLAYREARENGAITAIMHERDVVTEAASATVWIVAGDGRVMTRDLSSAILAGITREATLQALRAAGVEIVEAAFNLDRLRAAREVFTTSAGALIAPVIEIDGVAVGDRRPGPVTRNVQRRYYTAMGADLAVIAPWL